MSLKRCVFPLASWTAYDFPKVDAIKTSYPRMQILWADIWNVAVNFDVRD